MPNSISARGLLAASAALAVAVPGAALASSAQPAETAPAKNVMLFVADGASWGTWDMASYWQYGALGQQPYDAFDVKLGMPTEPAGAPAYDPAAAWDTTPTGDEDFFEGYKTIKANATDSAAAGTALATGTKTTNGRVNVDPDGAELRFATQDMKDAGKATGVVTSVFFSHATPAAFGAQNVDRGDYHAIADQMINEGTLDLIMGGGHPDFDDEGAPRAPEYDAISEADWAAVNTAGGPMSLIETRAEFEALADGTLHVDGRLIGIPQINETLQANRDPFTTPLDLEAPGTPNLGFPAGHVLLETVPSLATMTEGALNHLGKDEDGLFLMVEGGAIDWMAHANATGRVIEETVDFNLAIQAAVDWVGENSSWEETLMIVLTDHGNGAVMGPESDTVAFQPIENNGAGVLPGFLWHSGSHTTENTLMWANGAGSEFFADYILGTDPGLRDILGFNDGSYVDMTSVNAVMARAAGVGAFDAEVIPLPAGVWLMGGGLAALGFARRRTAR